MTECHTPQACVGFPCQMKAVIRFPAHLRRPIEKTSPEGEDLPVTGVARFSLFIKAKIWGILVTRKPENFRSKRKKHSFRSGSIY